MMLYPRRLTGNYNECRPLFVKDASLLLAGSGSIVQVISTETGQLVGRFSGHERLVSTISTIRTESGEDLAVSASIDGVVIAWRIDDLSVVNRLDVGTPVYEMIVPRQVSSGVFITGKDLDSVNRESDELYLIVAKRSTVKTGGSQSHEESKDPYKLVMYDTKSRKTRRKVSSLRNARQCMSSMQISGEEHIIACNKRKLITWSTATRSGPRFTNSTGTITCIASCQESGVVATGHEKGEILLWHDIPQWVLDSASQAEGEDVPPPVSTELHWHAHPVQSLALSSDGGYLYSGGEEGVLVVWQTKTGQQSFVPRLGAALRHVSASVGKQKVAATSIDNSIHVIDAVKVREEWAVRSLFVADAQRMYSRHMERSSSGTSGGEDFLQSDPAFRCQIKLEPRSGCAVCNGYPGHLQALDLWTQTVRWTHEVVPYVRVSRTETHTKMFAPSVSLYEYATSVAGESLLATLDVRRGAEGEHGSSLKFWTWETSKSSYRLAAQVENPHGSSRVAAIAFSKKAGAASVDGGMVCASGGADGTIKLWTSQPTDANHPSGSGYNRPRSNSIGGGRDRSGSFSRRSLGWVCAFSFRHKDCGVMGLAFSRDGSLLAVAQENVVSLWVPSDVSLRASLVAPCADPVTFVSFVEPHAQNSMGGGGGEALIVVGTRSCLAVFDLLSLKLRWSVAGKFSAFASASSENDALPYETTAGVQYGYIAAASTVYKSTIDEDENLSQSQEHSVKVYSLYSLTPIASHAAPSKVASLAFSPDDGRTAEAGRNIDDNYTNTNSGNSAGLLVATGAEIIILTPRDVEEGGLAKNSENKTLAHVQAPALPGVPGLAADHSRFSVSTSQNGHAQVGEDFTFDERTNVTSKGSSDLFGEKVQSSTLPPVGAIASSFLGALLRTGATSDERRKETAEGKKGRSLIALPGEEEEQVMSDSDSEGEIRGYGGSSNLDNNNNHKTEVSVPDSVLAGAAQRVFLRNRMEVLSESLGSVGAFGFAPTASSKTKATNKNKSATPQKDSVTSTAKTPKSGTKDKSATPKNNSATKKQKKEKEKVDNEDEEQTEVEDLTPVTPAAKRRTRAGSASESSVGSQSTTGRSTRRSTLQQTSSLSSLPPAPTSARKRSASQLSELSVDETSPKQPKARGRPKKQTGSVLAEISEHGDEAEAEGSDTTPSGKGRPKRNMKL